MAFSGTAFAQEALRVAVFHTELSRDGPGLLYRDIARGEDAQVAAVVDVIASAAPDVIVLRGIDWDLDGLALSALAAELAEAGLDLPFRFAARPNRGIPTGLDIDGNGRTGDPEDAQSYGLFVGQEGLAVLSRWPIAAGEAHDFTQMLWADLPGALLPWPGQPDGTAEVLRLSSTAHWLLPIDTPDHGRLWLGAFAATTPVFDGPEDRNGRRNHDELRFWQLLLDGALPTPAPEGLILAGHANLDPDRGEGRREAIRALLSHPELQDPQPRGAADTLTVDWKRDDLERMRISYVLPSQDWRILDAGVVWPPAGTPEAETADTASRHRLVWVDVVRR